MCRLSALWSTCHVLLKLYVTSLSCNPAECLSCFTQTVCVQPLLQPCGVFVTFYSNCTQTASLATLWGVCHILLTLYVTSLSCSVSSLYVNLHNTVEHLSPFTQTVRNQPLSPPCVALVTFFSSYCMLPASLATLRGVCHLLLKLHVTSLSCSISLLYVSCMSASTTL